MSLSSITGGYGAYQTAATANRFQQFRAQFKNLSGALKLGDLGGAQAAYAALQKLRPANQIDASGTAQRGGQTPFSADYSAIGKALQSSDIESARAAFDKLQQDIQGASAGHHHITPLSPATETAGAKPAAGPAEAGTPGALVDTFA